MIPNILSTALLFALSVVAKPVVLNRSPVTLPISRRTNFTSIHNLLRHDQARAKFLKANGLAKAAGLTFQQDDVINEPVYNQAVGYYASVGVGSPPTTYTLHIDTGSSNTWVGANQAYIRTSTSVQTPNTVAVSYGSGSFSGFEYTDTVTLGPGLIITNQSIGVATTSQGVDNVDGLLGIGPVDLSVGTLSPDSGSSIPTVTDNLFADGVISANEIGISFSPTPEGDDTGVITWGGIDPAQFVGTVLFTPLTTTAPANQYWGIDQSIQYGDSTSILATTAGIVDTGSTLILIATDGYEKYKAATNSVEDSGTVLLKIPANNFNTLQSLFFTAGEASFELTANAQIWPRVLNTDIGGVAGSIYLIVSDIGTPSGQGLDFINGYTFLQRFYSVYDTANMRIGLAATTFTHSRVN